MYELGVVYRNIVRAERDVADRLASLGSATVHEAIGRRGFVGADFRPIQQGVRLAGSAVTVSCHPGDNLMIHAAVEVCGERPACSVVRCRRRVGVDPHAVNAAEQRSPDQDVAARIEEKRLSRRPRRESRHRRRAEAVDESDRLLHVLEALLDITAIRPAEALQIVRNALANDRHFDAAQKRCLARAGWEPKDLDLMEINEAFAAQAIAVNRQVGWDTRKVNVNGGAIALGHPLGASGARLMTMLVHELRRTGGRYGLASMCIGVGQGIALLVERVEA